MASIDPSLISDPKEQKWVVEISKILNNRLETINFETPSVSVFQVPETVTQKTPEAYEPQQIGLGPIHHFRPGLYKKMEQKKLDFMRKILHDFKIKDDKLMIVLNKVRKIVPVVRSCYDMFLQGDDDSLAWIFAIDGLFLLNLFHTYNSEIVQEKEDYLLFLKNKANGFKLEFQQLISKINIEESASSTRPQKESVVNSQNRNKEIMESVEDELPSEKQNPHMDRLFKVNSSKSTYVSTAHLKRMEACTPELLLQKEIVVTAANHTAWEDILQLPHHEAKLLDGPRRRSVAQDIMMIENQIPYMVLKEIDEVLHPSASSSSHLSNQLSPTIFRTICKIHSPLKLCSKSQAPTSVQHLLHYMYYSILNNVPIYKIEDPPSQVYHEDTVVEVPTGFATPSNQSILPCSISHVYNLAKKIPQEEIVQAYKQAVSILETFSQSEVLLPSVSKLYNKAEIRFMSPVKQKGIQNIELRFKSIYLPGITLNTDSEVILKNLVAYETLMADSDSFPLTEYIALMCGLVVDVDDVKLLRREDIIKGDLSNDEVAKLFTGMKSSIPTMKTKGKSKLQGTIHDINKLYECGPRMKTYLLLKKLARWLLVVLKAIGGFVESSWKIVAFMISIVTVFIFTWQVYCEVYGCDKTVVTLLPYASV